MKCYASLDETSIGQQIAREQKGRMLPGRNSTECWIARIAAAMACGMDGVNLFNIEYFDHEVQRDIMRHDIRDLDGVDVVETEGRDALGRVWRHETTVALEPWKSLDLPPSGLAVRSVAPAADEKGAVDVTLAAKAPSFFAWVSVADDPTGVFSDNLVTVLPGVPKVLRFRPGVPTTASSLRRHLSLLDLRGSY